MRFKSDIYIYDVDNFSFGTINFLRAVVQSKQPIAFRISRSGNGIHIYSSVELPTHYFCEGHERIKKIKNSNTLFVPKYDEVRPLTEAFINDLISMM